MSDKIQVRRDTAALWTSNNPTLSSGEMGYETDTGKFKIGDGSTAWTSLAYSSSIGADHGGLAGLGDDDHTQYHNDARGDARYSQLAHTHTESDITDLQAYLKAADIDTLAELNAIITDATLDDSSATRTPASHTHTESEITDLTHTDADAIHDNVAGEIAALTEKVTPVNGDWVIIEDSAATNAKKKAQLGNLPGGGGGASALNDLTDVDTATTAPTDGQALVYDSTGAEWLPGTVSSAGAPSRVLLERITNPTTSQVITIPSGYDSIVIEGALRSSATVDQDTIQVYANGDTTAANYTSNRWAGVGAGTSSTQADNAETWIICGSNSPTNSYSPVQLRVDTPDTVRRHSWFATSGAVTSVTTNHWIANHSVFHDAGTAAALTSLTISSTTSLVGELRVYGEKSISVEDSETITVRKVIGSITNTTAGEFDFTDIPAGYDRLILKGYVRSDTTANQDALYCYLNTDTTDANYHSQEHRASDGLVASAEAALPYFGLCSDDGSLSGAYTDIEGIIEGYDDTSKKQQMLCYYSYERTTDNLVYGSRLLVSSLTAAINRIRIRTDNHATDQLTGTLTLYGEKQGVLPVTSGSGLTESNETVTTGDITGVAGTLHVCTIAGMTANRNLTLPSAQIGERVGVYVVDGDPDYELILKGAASQTINGGTAATEWSRVFIQGECVIFRCTAVNTWIVEYDGRIPCSAKGRPSSDVTTIPINTITKVNLNTEHHNVGDILDTTTDYRFNIRRAGTYYCRWQWRSTVTSGFTNKNARGYVFFNGTERASGYSYTYNTNIYAHPATAVSVEAAAGDYVDVRAYLSDVDIDVDAWDSGTHADIMEVL